MLLSFVMIFQKKKICKYFVDSLYFFFFCDFRIVNCMCNYVNLVTFLSLLIMLRMSFQDYHYLKQNSSLVTFYE